MKIRIFHGSSESTRAFTLVEVIIALALSGLSIAAINYGYVTIATRAEWSGYSLAAQSLAQQGIEQARACKWDPYSLPPVDELVSSNFPMQTNILDVPVSKTNVVYATNFTTITQVRSNPPVKCIRVDTIWTFRKWKLYTNTILTYRAPDS